MSLVYLSFSLKKHELHYELLKLKSLSLLRLAPFISLKLKPDVPKWFENDLKNILVFSGSKNNK